MANMSYCRFRNTRSDMEDCLEALDCGRRLSKDEAKAGYRMFDDILSFCRNNGIIESYDCGELEALFDGLIGEEDD